ncbi:LysR substrate-binding domain-containing protein [uncultured Kiloniella sp.]|uniref:LysR substrate-binding domain-containing protein n=1 Tax=uncultured Kiloniella sp. TaxID=1133091 RepID=UPI00263345AA|nr:LysR substrate-binding domain-containing protein [uncultured Kiloniella sp.]
MTRKKTDAPEPVKAYKIHTIINYFDNKMRDLPPLKALRAFEACYRLRSYTRAAETLNVGQPAISHQIRLLEQDLGIKLFIKKGSLISATTEADDYYQEISQALGRIAEISRNLRDRSNKRTFNLATYPGIAAYWALPRLYSCREQTKNLSIKVTTIDKERDINWDQVNCAILFGTGNWPGYECQKLISEDVLPVTAPLLAEQLAPYSPERILTTAPLIHLEDTERRWFDWSDWQKEFAPNVRLPSDNIVVTNHGLAIHQALQGQGIVLGWTQIIQDLIEGGSLVPLHNKSLTSERGYWLVAPKNFFNSEAGRIINHILNTEEAHQNACYFPTV